ncbi:MAG: sulfurtransferase TusA family protein [Caldilineales bacterium]|nr:sulfurtransferase TusA family protein [Caldilineales bacterium]
MITFNQELDVKGLNCPMPLLKARQAIKTLPVGETLRVISSDRGSVKDFQAWAKTSKDVELLDQGEESENGSTLFTHYVKRTK